MFALSRSWLALGRSWAALRRARQPNMKKKLPSCERKAAQSNVFRYLETSVTYFFVLFVRKRILFENRLHLSKINAFCYSQRLPAHSGSTFGSSWAALGRSWGAPGPLLVALGPLSAALVPPLAAFGCSWAALGTTRKKSIKFRRQK